LTSIYHTSIFEPVRRFEDMEHKKEVLVMTTVRLPKDLMKAAKQYALDHDDSLQTVIEAALREYLPKGGRK
jgi:hypothetical protein